MAPVNTHARPIRNPQSRLSVLAGGGRTFRPDGWFWYEAEKEPLAERQKQGEVPPGITDNLPI
jgi:hypothetical protein